MEVEHRAQYILYSINNFCYFCRMLKILSFIKFLLEYFYVCLCLEHIMLNCLNVFFHSVSSRRVKLLSFFPLSLIICPLCVPGCNTPLNHLLILVLYTSIPCLLNFPIIFLFSYFLLIYFVTHLSFENRPATFPSLRS